MDLRNRTHRVIGVLLAAALIVVVVVGVAWIRFGPLGAGGPCRQYELLSAGEVEDLLGAPVSGVERSGDGIDCTYALDGGAVLRVTLPLGYSAPDSAGLRALRLDQLAAGRATVGPPDGAGRASYSSTSRGETLIASYGGMQLVLALRTEPPGDRPAVPAGIREGVVRVAGELITRVTPDLYTLPPGEQDTEHISLSRDLCAELVTVAQVEEHVGLLVRIAEWNPGSYLTACRFRMDERATVDVVAIDHTGQRSAADVAALRRIDLDAVPVRVHDEDAEAELPGGTAYLVRVDAAAEPTGTTLQLEAGTTTLQVSYSTAAPDREPVEVEAVRPELVALAEQVLANL